MFKGNQIYGNLVRTATHYYDNGKPESELYYKDSKVFLLIVGTAVMLNK
jgi:hypothetical protein